MNYLFIHQNFPGQYRHLVRHLADQRGNQVYFVTQPNDNAMVNVTKVSYPKDARGPVNCHAYSAEIDRAIHAGATVAGVCQTLREQGFVPDLIVGHSGWGETLFVKDVFPDVPLLANFEFYYHARGVDVGFDPEFVSVFNEPSRLRARNATNLLAFEAADWGHSATQWQRDLYPAQMRQRISVLHEGVDTTLARPRRTASFTLPHSGRVLTRKDQVVTYVARNLEPYRGFHVFMRALPQLLRRCPQAQVVIVGGDGVSYGAPPAAAQHVQGHAAGGAGIEPRPVARAFSRHDSPRRLPAAAAGVGGARLSHLSVRAVLVVPRSHGERLPGHRLVHPAGAGGAARRAQRTDRGFLLAAAAGRRHRISAAAAAAYASATRCRPRHRGGGLRSENRAAAALAQTVRGPDRGAASYSTRSSVSPSPIGSIARSTRAS